MTETYLPGNARERILDLMKHGKVTQKDLAQRIDITESALSRFLSGATDRLDSEHLLRIARCFGVSTDFLFGETAVPDRKNYEIVELGLSAQAARNLYSGRVCADVMNRLLESPRFAELIFLLQRYFNGTLAQGYAPHNELLATLSDAVLSGAENENAAKQAAQEIGRSKLPVYQADLTQIQNQLWTIHLRMKLSNMLAFRKRIIQETGVHPKSKNAKRDRAVERKRRIRETGDESFLYTSRSPAAHAYLPLRSIQAHASSAGQAGFASQMTSRFWPSACNPACPGVAVPPNRSPAKLVRFGEEEPRSTVEESASAKSDFRF